MLCPVPTTGETGTTSNWLDRLRSSRGLPAADDSLGLDHFLNGTDDCQFSPTTDESTQSNDSRPDDRSPPPPQWLGIQAILSDLFNVSDPRRAPGRRRRRPKGARKQPNPRCCQADDRSSGCARKANEVALASPASLNCSGDDDDEEEEVERGRGYSRSEVTVIDTSCQGWKFEKVVYRRKDAWKVRDKKGRPCWAGGLKKRKRLDWTENANVDSGKKKKKKKKGKVLEREKPVAGFEDNGAAKYNVQDRQEEKTEESCKETRNGNCQVSESRSLLSRSSAKSKKTGSSAPSLNTPLETRKKGKKLYKNLIKGGG